MLVSIMIVHRSRIDRLDVPARSIFRSPAIFKREALTNSLTQLAAVRLGANVQDAGTSTNPANIGCLVVRFRLQKAWDKCAVVKCKRVYYQKFIIRLSATVKIT